jgi:hypothetical protein
MEKKKIKVKGANPLLKKQSGMYGRSRGASRSAPAVRVSRGLSAGEDIGKIGGGGGGVRPGR